VFVLDWNRPAPLTEFFVPAMPELHFPEFRDCVGAFIAAVTELCFFLAQHFLTYIPACSGFSRM